MREPPCPACLGFQTQQNKRQWLPRAQAGGGPQDPTAALSAAAPQRPPPRGVGAWGSEQAPLQLVWGDPCSSSCSEASVGQDPWWAASFHALRSRTLRHTVLLSWSTRLMAASCVPTRRQGAPTPAVGTAWPRTSTAPCHQPVGQQGPDMVLGRRLATRPQSGS